MDQSLRDTCARMNIEELVSQQGFALHKNLLNLYKSVRTCRLCRHAPSSLKPLLPLNLRSLPCRHAMRHLSSESSKSSLSESNQKLLATQQARAFYGQHNHPKHGLTIVVSDVDSETRSEHERSISWLFMRTLPGDPAQRSGAKTARLIPESTSSLTSTINALEWLKECLLCNDCFEGCTHIIDNDLQKCLAKTHGNNKKLESLSLSKGLVESLQKKEPRRLRLCEGIQFLHRQRSLSLGDPLIEEERAARLVEIIDTGRGTKLKIVPGSVGYLSFAALSYRWGGLEAIWQTTTKNLGMRLTEFNIVELPKTLSDTVQVVRKLGLEWVWIYSLCIIQDDKEDWQGKPSRWLPFTKTPSSLSLLTPTKTPRQGYTMRALLPFSMRRTA